MSALLIIMILILLGILGQGSRTQKPAIVSVTSAANSLEALSKACIAVQFSTTMEPGASWFDVWDEYNQGVAGTFHWTTTAFTNDTLIFTPSRMLKPETRYSLQGIAQSAAGGRWFAASFNSKVLTADTTYNADPGSLPVEKKDSKDQSSNLELPKVGGVQGSLYGLVKTSDKEDSPITTTTLRRSARSTEDTD